MKIILFSSGNYGSFYLKKLLSRGHKVIAGVPNLKDIRYTKELKLKKIPIIELTNFKKKKNV
jgi:putative NADH-flavin reductase